MIDAARIEKEAEMVKQEMIRSKAIPLIVICGANVAEKNGGILFDEMILTNQNFSSNELRVLIERAMESACTATIIDNLGSKKPKPRYKLFWSLHEKAFACFHADDSVKRDGHFLIGPLLAYLYEDSIYLNHNKPIRSYSML